jgi:hypothetical protein
VRSWPVDRDGVPGAVVQSRSESILLTCLGNPVNGEFGPFYRPDKTSARKPSPPLRCWK